MAWCIQDEFTPFEKRIERWKQGGCPHCGKALPEETIGYIREYGIGYCNECCSVVVASLDLKKQ